MDWIVGVLLLIAGAVIGFFVAKYVFTQSQSNKSNKENEETVKEVLAQQAASHLNQSRVMVDAMMRECDKLRQQMDEYEDLLRRQTQSDDGEKLNYFGEHATAIIRNQQSAQRRQSDQSDVQPRDFSMGGSGLFDGSDNKQVVDKK